MDEYKQDFTKKNGEKWMFQDEFNEERYKNFKEQIDAESGFSGRKLQSHEIDEIKKRHEDFLLNNTAPSIN